MPVIIKYCRATTQNIMNNIYAESRYNNSARRMNERPRKRRQKGNSIAERINSCKVTEKCLALDNFSLSPFF